MIKKLLSLSAAVLLMNVLNAQSNLTVGPKVAGPENRTLPQSSYNVAEKTQSTNVTDTLWYFYNKYYYKTPTANYGFYTIKSPYSVAAAKVSHFGSTFLNTSTVTVNGMYILAGRGTTSGASVPVRILLCNATSSGQPILPAIDSLTSVLTGTTGVFVGGALTTPHTMTGNFSILYRNASLVSTDTILGFMASTTPTTGISYGENLSYLRLNGTVSTTSATIGADYEYQVIPIVSFPITATATASAPSATCVPVTYTFTNNTNQALLMNRQFNLNMFLAKWQPFSHTTAVGDSVFVWNAGDASADVTNMPNSYVHAYNTAGAYTGSLTANYQLGADNGQKKSDIATWPITTTNCIPTGINEAAANADMVVFPNPSNGMVTIKNLSYNSTLELFNLLGESMYKEKVSDDSKSLDFSRLPAGNYYLKVTSAEGKTTVKKLHFN